MHRFESGNSKPQLLGTPLTGGLYRKDVEENQRNYLNDYSLSSCLI